ncbi:hypothetical protein J8273_1463 [Carpediemonas membranifera]|uniref:Uncharacterized protein n=1 Tax=Carpediemonas membranifera TaxID=201153 RepID=A0A8J6BAZ4_9EUKA|nr:hypothetical protein J8273_1463 [Carpediemonas membranifera]|eukprot:KAG9396482.1 hypothetical protein J8273_1463 [Carpediemonas membranifera]
MGGCAIVSPFTRCFQKNYLRISPRTSHKRLLEQGPERFQRTKAIWSKRTTARATVAPAVRPPTGAVTFHRMTRSIPRAGVSSDGSSTSTSATSGEAGHQLHLRCQHRRGQAVGRSIGRLPLLLLFKAVLSASSMLEWVLILLWTGESLSSSLTMLADRSSSSSSGELGACRVPSIATGLN